MLQLTPNKPLKCLSMSVVGMCTCIHGCFDATIFKVTLGGQSQICVKHYLVKASVSYRKNVISLN